LTSFSIMQFIFSPILGKISDKVGRRPVLLLSILTSIVSFILFTLANSFLILLLSRIIAGLATEAAVAQAYIADITDEKERGEKMGKVGAAVGAGFIFGPAIGGFLSTYGFSATGFGATALAFLNLLFVFFFLPESIHKTQSEKSVDTAPKISYFSQIRIAMKRPLVGSALAISFIITLSFSAIQVIVPLLTISFFDFSSVGLSYVFIYIGIIQIVLQGFIIGRLIKKVGEEKLLAFGPLLMFLGIITMTLIPNIGIFLFSLATMAFGNGILQTVVPSFISKRTPANEQGSLLGIAQSVSSISRVPGPIIGGFVVEATGLARALLSHLFLDAEHSKHAL
ncbi:MAG: MFS transporter, partial [Candidatus Bathyarchaeota archaeon]